jgi:hypothetical protein
MRMESELPLPVRSVDGPPDLTVAVGEPHAVPWERPTEDLVAELVGQDGWPRYSFCRDEDGTTRARFYSLADFTISADGRSVVCHPDPEVDPAIAALLVVGGVAAYLLSSGGTFVLHASAVEIHPGRAFAFVGASARGKTTTAALLCARGLPLVTDDVLPVVLSTEPPRCIRGGEELRLRPQQSDLLETVTQPANMRRTADGRIAVRLPIGDDPEPELAGIAIPYPDREGDRVVMRELAETEAVMLLVRTTRIEGWRATERIRQTFDQAVDLVRRVPVVELSIPWGPPFPGRVRADVFDQLLAVTAGGRTASAG